MTLMSVSAAAYSISEGLLKQTEREEFEFQSVSDSY
jgi:hypothetical protein